MSLRHELKRLGASSLVYLLPTFFARGISFLLSPVYAAVLGPSEFGIVGFAGTLAPLVTTLLGFGVASSAQRLHHDFEDDGSRRRFYGSILLFQMIVPLSIGLIVDIVLTQTGSPFASLPYLPFGRLVLWTGVLGVLPSALVNIFVARESPKTVTTYNLASITVTIIATVIMVVVLRKGAVGLLGASLIAAAINSVFAFVLLRPVVSFKPSWPSLRAALVFGVPIVPHQLSNWALSASDRAILERYVATADLGRYSLGYTFGSATSFISLAIGLALGPLVNRRLKADSQDPAVPKIGSFSLLVTSFVGLFVALVGGPVLVLVTRPDYRGAETVVPWVSAAFVLQALYQVVSMGTFFSKRTAFVPFVTAAAAASNILLNLVLVPKYGIRAAAITTFVAYATLAAAHGILAHRMHPIAWEYGRLARIGAAALVTYGVGSLFEGASITTLLARSTVTLLFPVLLVLFGAVTRQEMRRASELARGFIAARRA